MNGTSETDERNVVLAEHRALTKSVTQLEEWVTPGTPFGEDWGAELRRRTQDVYEHLRMHFAGEAEANVFNDVRLNTPHFAGRLSALAAEHSEILQSFYDVAEGGAALAAGDEARRARVMLLTQRAIATLRRHEAEENEIIMRSFWDDTGGPG